MSPRIAFDYLYDALVNSPADPHKTLERIERFIAKTIDTNDMVVMLQDLLGARAFGLVPPNFHDALTHCVQRGLCVGVGSYLH